MFIQHGKKKIESRNTQKDTRKLINNEKKHRETKTN